MDYKADSHNGIMQGDDTCVPTSIHEKGNDTSRSPIDCNHMTPDKKQHMGSEYTNCHLNHSSSWSQKAHGSSDKGNENVILIPDTPSPVFAKFAARKQQFMSSNSEQEPQHASIGVKRAINLDHPDRNSDMIPKKRSRLLSDHFLNSTASTDKKENINVFNPKESFGGAFPQSHSDSHRSKAFPSTSHHSPISPIKAESFSPLSGFVSAKQLLNLSPASQKSGTDFNVEYAKKQRKAHKTDLFERTWKRSKVFSADEQTKKQFLSAKESSSSDSMQIWKSVSDSVRKLKGSSLNDHEKKVTTKFNETKPSFFKDRQKMLDAKEHKTDGNSGAIKISSSNHTLHSRMKSGTSKVQKSSVQWLKWQSDSESHGSDSDLSDETSLRDILSSASELTHQSEKSGIKCNNPALPDHFDKRTLSTSSVVSKNRIINSGPSSNSQTTPIVIGHTSTTGTSEDKHCSKPNPLLTSPNKCLYHRPLNSFPKNSQNKLSIGLKGQDIYSSKYSPDKKEQLIKLHMSRLKPCVDKVHALTSDQISSHNQSGKDMYYSNCNQTHNSQPEGDPHEFSPKVKNVSSSKYSKKLSSPAELWNSPSPVSVSSVFQNAAEGSSVSCNANSVEENNVQKTSFSQDKTYSEREVPRIRMSSAKVQINSCLQRNSPSVHKNSVHGTASKLDEKRKSVEQSETVDQSPKRTRTSTISPRNPIRVTSPGRLGGPNNPIYVDLTPGTDSAVRAMTQEDRDAELARSLQEELDREFAMSLQRQETQPPEEASGFTPAEWSEPLLPSMNPDTLQYQSSMFHRQVRHRHTRRRVEADAHSYMLENIDHQMQNTALQQLLQAINSRNRYARGRGRSLMANVLLTSPADDNNSYETLMELSELIGEVKEKGLTKAQTNRLPIKTFKKMESGSCDQSEECLICMCEYEDGDSLKMLPCFHQFHAGCIDKWIMKNATCPVCRVRVDLA